MRSFIPEADLWPYGDLYAYHDLHVEGAGDQKSTFGRITARFGAPRDVDDLSRKAQLLNYETFRAIYEGFNSRMWHDASGVIVWMSQPSWPSLIWDFYSWDYTPNSSLFGAQKGAEPVHIQLNVPDCKVAIINHGPQPLADVTAKIALYDLSGRPEQTRQQTLTAGANACTDVFTVDWPASGAHLAKLELRDSHGKLLSENFYWHARKENELQQLNSLPPVTLKGKWHVHRSAQGLVVEGKVTNPAKTPALSIRLTLRDATTGARILPVFYDDNYFSLLPGESRSIRIAASTATPEVSVTADGWNIEPTNFSGEGK
jgi:hypothetical protein